VGDIAALPRDLASGNANLDDPGRAAGATSEGGEAVDSVDVLAADVVLPRFSASALRRFLRPAPRRWGKRDGAAYDDELSVFYLDELHCVDAEAVVIGRRGVEAAGDAGVGDVFEGVAER
jgi:hypothetical protein